MKKANWRAIVAVCGLVAAACGTAPAGESTSTTMIETTTSTTKIETTTSTVLPSPTTSPDTTTTTELLGQPIDFGPMPGDILMVIGVAHDDVLNMRAAPGPTQPILATIAPTATDVTAIGETRELPGAFWIKVEQRGVTGWVNLSYVGYEGATDDTTSTVVADLGEIPTASTMTELGRLVAQALVSEDPPSKVVLVVAETIGDLGEVTYDVIGLGDDAVRGMRLHVFGEPVSDGFSLKAVELTALCGRGATEDGLCV